jgi:hypothetical protein
MTLRGVGQGRDRAGGEEQATVAFQDGNGGALAVARAAVDGKRSEREGARAHRNRVVFGAGVEKHQSEARAIGAHECRRTYPGMRGRRIHANPTGIGPAGEVLERVVRVVDARVKKSGSF